MVFVLISHSAGVGGRSGLLGPFYLGSDSLGASKLVCLTSRDCTRLHHLSVLKRRPGVVDLPPLQLRPLKRDLLRTVFCIYSELLANHWKVQGYTVFGSL